METGVEDVCVKFIPLTKRKKDTESKVSCLTLTYRVEVLGRLYSITILHVTSTFDESIQIQTFSYSKGKIV